MTTHRDISSTPVEAPDGVAPPLKSADTPIKRPVSLMGQTAMLEGQAALRGMHAGSREWLDWAQEAFRINAEALEALSACRSAHHAMLIQSGLLQEHFNLLLDNGSRMTRATWNTALREHEEHARSA